VIPVDGAPPHRGAARRSWAGLAVALAFVVLTALRVEAAVVVDPSHAPALGPGAAAERSDARVVVEPVRRAAPAARPIPLATLPVPVTAGPADASGPADVVDPDGDHAVERGPSSTRAPPR
jgi:hypothetical protein